VLGGLKILIGCKRVFAGRGKEGFSRTKGPGLSQRFQAENRTEHSGKKKTPEGVAKVKSLVHLIDGDETTDRLTKRKKGEKKPNKAKEGGGGGGKNQSRSWGGVATWIQ